MQFARATALFWAAAAAQSVRAADADDGQSPRRLLMMDDFDFNNGFNNDFNCNDFEDDRQSLDLEERDLRRSSIDLGAVNAPQPRRRSRGTGASWYAARTATTSRSTGS